MIFRILSNTPRLPYKIWGLSILTTCFSFFLLEAQNEADAFLIKSIYDNSVTKGAAYDWLSHLTQEIGARISGSPQSMAAVEYTRQIMNTLELDEVRLQECLVPHWSRGEKEMVRVVNSNRMGSLDLAALSLGNSIGTGPGGITAEVIEVKSLEQVDSLGRDGINGKIVFYNRALDNTQINTFRAYGGAVDQRVYGASRASKYGALAVVVRSMTTKIDDFPHTGSVFYDDQSPAIPALAISTKASNVLSDLIREENVRLHLRNTSKMLSPKKSYNVIGEIKGSEKPDEIILVGGHLDSWDVGEGAHDDGAGCVQALDVLNILKMIGYQPKRTIRCVMFMNEENGQQGAITYKEKSDEKEEFHLAAIESDRGGFTPRGFTCDGDASIFNRKFKQVTEWESLLAPYGLSFKKGGSGADITRLKNQKGLLFGFWPDSQRYFDYHHTASDVFEAVNKRELQLGVAAIASLVYLLDKYGLED